MQVFESDKWLSPVLIGESSRIMLDLQNLASTKLAPVVPVPKRRGDFVSFPRGSYLRTAAQLRQEGQESAGTDFTLEESEGYRCKSYALHVDLGDYTREEFGTLLNADLSITRFLTQQVVLKREIDFMSNFFKQGVWATDVTPADKFTDDTKDPIKYIRSQLSAHRLTTGQPINVLGMGTAVIDTLVDHAHVIDRVRGGSSNLNPAMGNRDLLARLLGVEEVVEASLITNTAIEGQQDAFTYNPGDSILGLHRPPNAGMMDVSSAKTFVWNRGVGGAQGELVRKIRREDRICDRIEVEMFWDHKIIAPDLGLFIYDVL
jgi:hypothetical protein